MVISGRKLARQIREEARADVEKWVSAGHRRPHLSVILVGDNPASHSYVLNKTRAAADVGMCKKTETRFSRTRPQDYAAVQYQWANVCSRVVFSPRPPTGISSETILKHSDISEEELLDLIYKLNTDHRVDGLLVQLPLPGMEKLPRCQMSVKNCASAEKFHGTVCAFGVS